MAETGSPKSWYPAALSKQIGRAPFPLRAFARDYVLFRGESGAVSAIERYCAHMGADLSRGRVIDERLQCPLHGWTFGHDGGCTYLDRDGQRDGGQLGALAVCEVGGIVFVWPGASPEWPFPELTGLQSCRAARPRLEHLPCPMEAIGLNGFDIWHYGIVHRRKVRPDARVHSRQPHHLGLKFNADVLPGKPYDNLLIKAGYGELDVQLDYWGGNLIFVRNQSGGYLALIALAPDGGAHCQMYLGVFAEKRETITQAVLQQAMLEIFRWVAWNFLRSDMPAVSGMRPREGALVSGKDDIAKQFWHWWNALPRIAGDLS